jgi:predicted dehydrogenase
VNKIENPAFAIVGMGGFARTHIRYMEEVVALGIGRQVAQVAIKADQQQFAPEVVALRQQGVEVFSSLRELLAQSRQQIDVVTVPTGIPLHRPMCQAALEAGCHVVLEKPAAGSVQDVDALLAAATRAGKRVAVGFQGIYSHEVQTLKAWICEGRFGAVHSVRAWGCWPRPPTYYARNGWAGKLAVGDTWVLDAPHHNALGHAVNQMAFVASARPQESLTPVALTAELYRANPIESADTAVFRMESTEGVEVFFAVSHCVGTQHDPVFRMETEKAIVETQYRGGTVIHWRDGRNEVPEFEPGRVGVFEDMARVLRGERQALLCPLALARTQVLITCATFDSAPVATLPEQVVRVRQEDGLVWVEGMDEVVQRAAQEGQLFSEMGVPWARAGRRVDLQGYGYFPGARTDGL